MTLNDFRGHFPIVGHSTYADAAAIGPLPREAAAAASALLTDLSTRGSLVLPAMFEPVESARQQAATLLGCAVEDVGFTDCTSQSMNLLARMAAQDAPDDRCFVTLRDEFPSTTVPWLHHGFSPQWVQPAADGHYPVEAMASQRLPHLGVQFHPELKSRPFAPHPLFTSFIGAAKTQSRLV